MKICTFQRYPETEVRKKTRKGREGMFGNPYSISSVPYLVNQYLFRVDKILSTEVCST